ncbi:MAG: DNA repair protein RecN [Phototrophicaceae bacterium]
MLEELRIQNFAIIDKLTVDFTQGFNVITGETGAGKSIVVDAVELLLGKKPDKGSVRAGTDKAIVEGIFALDERAKAQVIPILMDSDLIHNDDEADFLTLSREVRKSGRSSCRINGMTCNSEVLNDVGAILIDIHGQSGHLSLFKPRAHMDLLDRYADLLEVRDALSEVVNTLHSIRRDIKVLTEDKDALQRKADLLRYEVDDIDEAQLKAEEEEALTSEYNRLANSEKLAELSNRAFSLLSEDEDDDFTPAVDALQQVLSAMEKLVKLDPDQQDDYQLAQEIVTGAQELSINLGRYVDDLDHDPERLNILEERLDLIKKLKKRYGADTVQDLLDYADKVRAELASIDHSEERLEELHKQEDKTLRHIGELSERISKIREVAGRALAKKVVRELADLRMEQSKFEVSRTRKLDPDGAYGKDGKRYKFDASGIEEVEFLLSANPGEPLRPLVKVASGGEAARIMLALKKVLTQADYTPTLIFDEIDTGIGGRLGAVVGEKLWTLTDGHQVLCVTHLPQLASFGDKHFHVTKQIVNQRTTSHLTVLDQETTRITELAEMLGALGESGLESARALLTEAHQRKDQMVKEVELERQQPPF